MRARSEEEISKLSERVQHLQKLYESQELIISKNGKHFIVVCMINYVPTMSYWWKII